MSIAVMYSHINQLPSNLQTMLGGEQMKQTGHGSWCVMTHPSAGDEKWRHNETEWQTGDLVWQTQSGNVLTQDTLFTSDVLL